MSRTADLLLGSAYQPTLFDLVAPDSDWREEEAEQIALGILRHGSDLTDHQRGFIVLDWDTAGGGKQGDLIPAWICCVCGSPKPNEYWLETNHYCGMIPGCLREGPRGAPWAFWLHGPATGGGGHV